MKVALVSTRNRLATGIDRYAATLGDALRGEGLEVADMPIRRRPVTLAGREFGGFASLWLQRTFATPPKADIVHACDPAVIVRGTQVVTVLDLLTEQFPEWYLRDVSARLDWSLTRARARRVPIIITISHATREEVIERWGVSPERVHAIHLGIDAERFHPVDGPVPYLSQDKPNIVYAGDDNPRKNVSLIVRAMVQLRERHGIDARLVRVGPSRFPGVHEWYRAFAREHRIDLVEPGFVDEDALVRLYSQASVFAWPSLGEGFGFPPLEAMACGASVVALDTPINREVCGEHARYHQNDPEEMADALFAAINANEPLEGRLKHARSFSWARCARQTAAIYGKVLADE